MNVLQRGMQGLVRLNIGILENPWKSIKVAPFHGNCYKAAVAKDPCTVIDISIISQVH